LASGPTGSARPNTPDCGASTTGPRNEPHATADFNGFVLLDFASLRLEKWKMVRTVPRDILPRGLVDRSTGVTEQGPLTRKVMEYQEVMKRLVPTAHSPQDWNPLAQLVAVDEFERVGTFREVHNWQQYVQMLCQWAGSIGTFETTVKLITELPGLVYFEIEERHFAEERTTVVNSLTVFEFDGDEKIRNIRVYLQQAR
jgi:hypothetical protein